MGQFNIVEALGSQPTNPGAGEQQERGNPDSQLVIATSETPISFPNINVKERTDENKISAMRVSFLLRWPQELPVRTAGS